MSEPLPEHSAQRESGETGNPFASRYVRPGAAEFIFPEGESAARLVERFEELGGWAQIVGPHGAGKSTLLAALVPELEASGRQVIHVALHDGQRNMPEIDDDAPAGTVLIIDGSEQLSRWSWWMVQTKCRSCDWQLLVTTHQPRRLPVLFRMLPTEALAVEVAARLQAGRSHAISPDRVRQEFAAHGGDLRETLFALYDVYEANRRRETGRS